MLICLLLHNCDGYVFLIREWCEIMNWCYFRLCIVKTDTMIWGSQKVLSECKYWVWFNLLRAEWKWKCESGFRRRNSKELWVEKYKPRSFEELAVHKKKVKLFGLVLQTWLAVAILIIIYFSLLQVEEVKGWFEERLINSKVVGIWLSKFSHII